MKRVGLKIILMSMITIGLLQAQKKHFFYFNLNGAEEYHSNLYRLPDSLKKADSRFNAFARVGFRKNWPMSQKAINVYYENRYRRYYKNQTFSRMEHILFGHGYFALGSLGRLIVTNRLRFRNYQHSLKLNSLRNIFSFYLRTIVTDKLQLNSGYRRWLKNYPNTVSYQNYSSNRLFLNGYYAWGKKGKIGFLNELNWHQGNIYPFGPQAKPGVNLNGFRYKAELSGDRIIGANYFIDLRYRFEWDQPQEVDIQNSGEHTGDESTEEILAEDSDFDYVKHQLSTSLLYKFGPRLAFLIFAVVQTKRFRHWRIQNNGPLRDDFFYYFTLTAKYRLNQNLFAEFYFNLENNHSNHSFYQYSRQVTGAGLRIKL